MTDKNFVKHHIYESPRASVAEMNGNEALCHQLKVEIRSRFRHMSDEELWELALMTSSPPERPVDVV